jgi:uncharacterized membrane protein YoaK (UPF0700 family)
MNDEHRTLMPLLFGLTAVSGLIDAVSFLALGHVFVANMTGNVVLLGFAFAGARGISISGSLTALAAFMFGATIGGRLSRRHGESGAHLLSAATAAKIVFMLLAGAIAFVYGPSGVAAFAIIIALGVSMGLQNAAVRSLGVPDITTTVVTQTITGIAADSPLAGGSNTRLRRRVASVLIMFGGALAGALLTFRLGVGSALAAAALTLVVVSLWAWRLTKIAGERNVHE